MPVAYPPGSHHCAVHAALPTLEEEVSDHPPALLRAPTATPHAGVFHEHPVCSWVIKCDTKQSKSSTVNVRFCDQPLLAERNIINRAPHSKATHFAADSS